MKISMVYRPISSKVTEIAHIVKMIKIAKLLLYRPK